MSSGTFALDTQTSHNILWTDGNLRFSASVSRDAAAELRNEFMRGFKAVAAGEAETGGFLFGRIGEQAGRFTITIEGISPLPIEPSPGSPWRLTESDELEFAETLKGFEGQAVIGWYHSSAHSEKTITEDDRKIAAKYFGGNASVLLQCYPDPAGAVNATICLWKAGMGEHRFDFQVGHISPVEQAMRAYLPPPIVPAPRSRLAGLVSTRGLVLAGTFAGILASAAFLQPGRTGTAHTEPPMVLQKVVAADPLPESPLDLKVTREADALRINWNGQAAGLSQAQTATFTIDDGPRTRVLNLSPQELRTGSLLYLFSGGDINFLLKVNGPAGSLTQSVRVLGHGGPLLARTAPPGSRIISPPQTTAQTPPAAAVESSAGEKDAPASEGQALNAFVPPPSIPRKSGRVEVLELPPPAGPLIAQQALPVSIPLSAARMSAPQLPAPAPVAPKTPSVIPARALKTVQPLFPATGTAGLLGNQASELDVDIIIDASGKVRSAAISKSIRVFNLILADAAVAAARKWEFQPAMLNGRPIESPMVLKFQFGAVRK